MELDPAIFNGVKLGRLWKLLIIFIWSNLET